MLQTSLISPVCTEGPRLERNRYTSQCLSHNVLNNREQAAHSGVTCPCNELQSESTGKQLPATEATNEELQYGRGPWKEYRNEGIWNLCLWTAEEELEDDTTKRSKRDGSKTWSTEMSNTEHAIAQRRQRCLGGFEPIVGVLQLKHYLFLTNKSQSPSVLSALPNQRKSSQ